MSLNVKEFIAIAIIVLAIIGTMFSVYIFGRRIEGTWVRQDDDTHVAGMTVEVKRVNGVLQGTIIDMTDGVGTFEVGLVKWYDLKRVGFGKYELYDLIGIGGSSTSYHYDGILSTIQILSGGQSLNVVNPKPGNTGNFQIWTKQK